MWFPYLLKPIQYAPKVLLRILCVSPLPIALSMGNCQAENAEEWFFDPSLLAGSPFGSSIDKFNRPLSDEMQPDLGEMILDISLNGTLVGSGVAIRFVDADGKVQPCFNTALLNLLQIKRENIAMNKTVTACAPFKLPDIQGSWKYDSSKLSLDFLIPQKFLLRVPKGFIPHSEWDQGITALWVRHNTNYYHSSYGSSSYNYAWSSLNGGINFGPWQLHNQSSMHYLSRSGQPSQWRWQNARTWVSRALPSIESQLTLGNAYTDASLFGSLSFNGVKLATDRRMWPQARQGYAPVVSGIANTASRVVVRQQDKIIYETSVPPGAFVIDDLYDTRFQGDLQVEVVGSDGITSRFTVPFSQIANSMRAGTWGYSLSAGKVRGYSDTNNQFLEGTLQYGVNNLLTGNAGLRLGDGYAAVLAGGVLSTPVGAMGLNATWSHAKAPNGSNNSGWRAEASYSKSFTTGTNVMLAAYRFSTENFRGLEDVLGERAASTSETIYFSDTLKQRNRLSLSMNQDMGRYGSLSVSASKADYYGQRNRDTQYQLNYSKAWRSVTLNVTATRQATQRSSQKFYFSDLDLPSETSQGRYTDNIIFVSLSIPLDWGGSRTNAMVSSSKARNNTDMSLSLSGTAGETNSLSWSLNGNRNRYSDNDASYGANSWGGSLQRDTRFGALRASYARSDNSHQYTVGTNGTLVLHSGGVTAGPWANDTFALVEAKGAQGATIQNGRGATIGRSGYALLPSLTPYRYNHVGLDSGSMSLDTELESSSQRVVPYAGALVGVRFATTHGRATLITTALRDGTQLPMGADVVDESGNSLGLVGQGGQIYARLPSDSGSLRVLWGTTKHESCTINWDLSQAPAEGIATLELPCGEQ